MFQSEPDHAGNRHKLHASAMFSDARAPFRDPRPRFPALSQRPDHAEDGASSPGMLPTWRLGLRTWRLELRTWRLGKLIWRLGLHTWRLGEPTWRLGLLTRRLGELPWRLGVRRWRLRERIERVRIPKLDREEEAPAAGLFGPPAARGVARHGRIPSGEECRRFWCEPLRDRVVSHVCRYDGSGRTSQVPRHARACSKWSFQRVNRSGHRMSRSSGQYSASTRCRDWPVLYRQAA